MSASLVGSEMCIRDSHCLGCVSGVGLGTVPGGRDQRLQVDAPGPGLRHCLLYTSDAADDM
eukprot:12885667-Alexandrium_andersonii.AAC.1